MKLPRTWVKSSLEAVLPVITWIIPQKNRCWTVLDESAAACIENPSTIDTSVAINRFDG